MTIDELKTILSFIESVTHWQEGRPDRHDALTICRKALAEEEEMQRLEAQCPDCGDDGGTTLVAQPTVGTEMSNDKILIDRAVVERAYQVASNEDKHDLMQSLDVALAASPAMPDDKDKRIAEIEAELLALKTQKPDALPDEWPKEFQEWYQNLPDESANNLWPVWAKFHLPAGAQEKPKESKFDELCREYEIAGTPEARLCRVFFEARLCRVFFEAGKRETPT